MKAVLWVVLVLAGLGPAGAAQVRFEAVVDRTRAGQADPILLTLSIVSDENLSHVPAPELDLGDFYVEGPAISTRVEMVNFHTTFTRELTYSLTARHTGKLSLGPARIELDGEVYKTKAIALEILPGTARQPAGGKGAAGAQGQELEDHLFVRVRADRQKVYVGQQVVLEYQLCYRYPITSVGFKEVPDYAGFWAKELYVAQQLKSHVETINGADFQVAPLRLMALYPTGDGVHEVSPLAISCKLVQQRGRTSVWDFLDDPFGGRGQAVVVACDPLRIEVLPLPQTGRPPQFSGAVGRYTLQAKVQPLTVAAGDPVTLKVEISGEGNINAIEAPDLGNLPGFTVYEPKSESEEKVEEAGFGGTRRFEYILIPQRGGAQEIPPVKFAFFDPTQGQYRTLQSSPIRLEVQGGLAPDLAAGPAGVPRPVLPLGQDLRAIKPDLQVFSPPVQLHRSALFWGFQALVPLAGLGLLLHRRRRDRLEGDVALVRRRRARGEAGDRLRLAARLREQGDSPAFHAEIQRALLALLADRLERPAAGLTSPVRVQLLAEKGVPEALVQQVEELLAAGDFARFASGSQTREEMAQVEARAAELMAALEQQA
ncbi:MAG: protein BatD [Candidatus Latescibacteria bacterium]|nr:protein BatD [Candidatus Latescibacterota bacterium]